MLLVCGSNSFSHLALAHDQDVSSLTRTVALPTGEIIDLVSVSAHTLLLVRQDQDSRNVLYGVGTNTVGQLGRPCALRDDEDKQVLKNWRSLNLVGELEGDYNAEEWEPVKIGATWTTSFVVYRRTISNNGGGASGATGGDREDMIVACGSNDFNELGYADVINDRSAPITTPSSRPRVVDAGLQAGEWVEMLGCGQRHVMLVITNAKGGQRVVGWGAGRRGEFDISTLSGPAADTSSAKDKGKGKGKATATPRTYPPTTLRLPLEPDERIINVALGASHTVVLTSRHRVLAWGSDQKGQIADTASLHDIKQITTTWGGSYFVDQAGGVWSQGSNIYSQLLHEQDGRAPIEIPSGWQVQRIVAGSEHLLVHMKRDEEQSLWVGGWNEHGNLGLGDQKDRACLERVPLPPGEIRGIWGGCASQWVWIE